MKHVIFCAELKSSEKKFCLERWTVIRRFCINLRYMESLKRKYQNVAGKIVLFSILLIIDENTLSKNRNF